MEPAYWHERWARGETGWEQKQPNGLLVRHWSALGLAPGARVFVPLCGKSIDMAWLAERGHRIFGVDLVEEALTRFFAERGLVPARRQHRLGALYEAGPYALLAADAFTLSVEDLADCDGFYDRAALVALPPDMRARYVREVLGKLSQQTRGLLISLEIPEPSGPPFSVESEEIARLFSGWWVCLRERCDLRERDPDFAAGRLYAYAVAWQLERLA